MVPIRHRAKVWTMRWELVGSLLGLHQRFWEDRYEHIGRLPEEDRKTRSKECRRLSDYGSEVIKLGGHV
ncbi:hypothetical protein BHE74_00047856 [Ensete ventricosum]|nr:hypothetical protein BHE74_00047856 [Ensete ventricosum]RZS01613.1 hypothetical protein BHM03_00031516 [Ensete ventricosum]